MFTLIFVECMITNAPIFFVSIYSVDDQFSSLIVRRLQEVFLIYTIAGQLNLYQGTLSPTLRKPRVRFTYSHLPLCEFSQCFYKM